MKKLLMLATCLVFALSIEALSQSQQPQLKPTDPSSTVETRSSYVLEVAYNASLPPVFITVKGTETKPRWIWVTRFNHVPGWQYPEGVMPIRAVKFEAQYNGETADVRVTVFRGRRGFDQEDLVATYHLGLNDPRTVTKLTDLGIEAARITLLNLAPIQPLWPNQINKTSSISIEKISIGNDSLPGYEVTFRNLSQKPLAALKVEVAGGSRGPISSLFQGQDGQPLIEPGGTSEQRLHSLTEVLPGNQTVPMVSTPNSIVIRSAIYADGTFEGDLEPACMFKGFQVGRKLWLQTILPFFDQQLSEITTGGPEPASTFKEKFLALRYPIRTNAEGDSAVSSDCKDSQTAIEATVNGQKLQLLRELDAIITTRPAPPVNFKDWLKARAQRYRAWLARL
jgi:hypothetical protein